ncbi:hypothetical protein EXS74_01110 [Candidatus Woesearchaeota archaeon]|nr:hypothetical protein [Candidatus Woesearchaeota archaeon]
MKALDFLRANPSTLPLAYLCDMRIPGSLEELASPLEICRFVLNNGSLDLFRFYTGHVSEHDREVLQLTGVPFFLKPDFKEPRAFFAQVRAYRDSLDKA